jgi:hypothetical protein
VAAAVEIRIREIVIQLMNAPESAPISITIQLPASSCPMSTAMR